MSTHVRSASTPPRQRRIATDVRIFFWVVSGVIPIGLLLFVTLNDSELPDVVQALVATGSVAWILIAATAVRGELLRHVRTLSNLVESIRAQDFSMKGSRAREPGELAELYSQINTLTDSLKHSRESEQELLNVLEKVVGHINVAIVVCSSNDVIRLVNTLATVLLKSTPDKLVGTKFSDTVLAELPLSPEPKLLDFAFPGAEGRWQISQHMYRHQGQPSRIIFIADLKQVLSDEEIAAWQRLIRVISHEVNNSLAPITSLCQTLTGMIESPSTNQQDIRDGLNVIAERAKALQDFIAVYARIARLPEPNKVMFPVDELANRLQRIYANQSLIIAPFPTVRVYGDPVHLEQALINLIKNALEANPPSATAVQLSCEMREGELEFRIVDHGAGISNPGNLFVPFYTTKDAGAGIGLVLCRQIAAKHHGRVSLENRIDASGAIAKLILPLPPTP